MCILVHSKNTQDSQNVCVCHSSTKQESEVTFGNSLLSLSTHIHSEGSICIKLFRDDSGIHWWAAFLGGSEYVEEVRVGGNSRLLWAPFLFVYNVRRECLG